MFSIADTRGESFIFRPLVQTDDMALVAFFAGLKEQARAGFGPHPLTADYARELCASRVPGAHNEYWVIVDRAGALVGYCLLFHGTHAQDQAAEVERYAAANVDIVGGIWLRMAPCLADGQRGHGLASAMMAPLFQIARAEGAQGLVLMGGVQAGNGPARRFYKRHGFVEAGQFHWQGVDNIDMYLPMSSWASRALSRDIVYCINGEVSMAQFRDLLVQSGLAERRPADDLECLQGMIDNSNLVVSAWQNDRLVGIARSVSDFHYACYLSDLAVSGQLQRGGVGKTLIAATRAMLGPRCKLILIAAPAAADYYAPLGFVHNGRCWVLE